MENEIKVLGTSYKIIFKNAEDDKRLNDLEGYTDLYNKVIVICNLKSREYYKDDSEEKTKIVENKILRHEIIHAFLYESGLDCNSFKSYSWAENEEMVDWFAIQSLKIFEVYKQLNLL